MPPDPSESPPPPPADAPPTERSANRMARAPWRNWGDHPVIAGVTVVASLLGIAAFVLDRWQGREASGCVRGVGRWEWLSTGGVVAIAEGGQLHWYRVAADPLPSLNGVWECDEGRPGHFTFRWRETQFVDTLNLSDDGERFLGANLHTGFKLSGTRSR